MDHVPSLKIGDKKLGQVTELSVPAIKQPLLRIRIVDEHGKFNSDGSSAALWQRGAPVPTAFGSLLYTRVVRNECVTRSADTRRIGKAKWELELELVTTTTTQKDDDHDDGDEQQQRDVLLENCDAGDSFNVLFENPGHEVDYVLKRLGFCAKTADAEHILEAQNVTESNGKFAHFPPRCTPRQLLSQFVDIRRAPSRIALRHFAEHAHEASERRRLLELCSAQGAMEFTNFIRKPNISLVELFCTFPSLAPPLSCLMECLPRLVPRHYTLCTYLPAQRGQRRLRFRFVYSVLQMPRSAVLDACAEFAGAGQKRYGACTQWLLQQRAGQTVQLVQKEPSKFRFLPPSGAVRPAPLSSPASPAADADHHQQQQLQQRLLLNTPLMMVGPGTGVAPFIAFLQKIRHCMQQNANAGGDADDCSAGGRRRVQRILFYASSNLDDEFLFKAELEQMVVDGVLSELVLCESRPTEDADTADAETVLENNNSGAVAGIDATDGSKARHHPRRVYVALRQRSTQVARFLVSSDADGDEAEEEDGSRCAGVAPPPPLFYACGDVKNMSRELWACLSDILQREKGFSLAEAIEQLKKLRATERLIEDVWS